MKVGEFICHRLNNLFPKIKVMGRESVDSYFQAQYARAKSSLAFYSANVDLRNKDVLDAGCSLGGKTVYYAENGCKSIIGIDMDESYVKYSKEFARKKNLTNVDFEVADLSSLPFDSDRFDIIFLNDVVEHIRRPILVRALTECKRVIRPAGKICLEFPPWTSWDAAHLYDYIYIPWCQILFPDKILVNVVKNMNPKPRFGKLSVVQHFQELNRITIPEFKDLVRKLEFQVIDYKPIMIKGIKILNYIPLLNKYFTRRFVAILSK